MPTPHQRGGHLKAVGMTVTARRILPPECAIRYRGSAFSDQ